MTQDSQDNRSNPNDAQDKASADLSQAAQDAMNRLQNAHDKTKTQETKITNTEVDSQSAEEENTTNDLQQEAYKAMKLEAERKREAQARPSARPETHTRFTHDMKLRLELIENGQMIIKEDLTHELIVGRGDNLTDYVPDIDLSPHGAYRLGLSRRHAIIQLTDEQLFVKDLNSRNGTFVNGVIVAGGATQIIRDGDELRFGNLAMRVIFETSPSQ